MKHTVNPFRDLQESIWRLPVKELAEQCHGLSRSDRIPNRGNLEIKRSNATLVYGTKAQPRLS